MTRLGELVKVHHGYAFPGSGFGVNPSLRQVVTPGNFAQGERFRESTKSFDGEVPDGYVLEAGTLIVTMTDLSKDAGTLGLSAVVPSGATFLHNQRIGRVEVLKPAEVSKMFLHYLFHSRAYRDYVVATATGTTVRHTSPSRLEGFEFELPSMPTQTAIADVLGALDDKIAANRRIARSTTDLQRQLWARGTADLPLRPLLDFASPHLGGTPPRSDDSAWDGTVAWASVRDMSAAPEGVLVSTGEGISTQASRSAKRLNPLPPGSIFLSARGTVGCVVTNAIPCAINQSAYAFVPAHEQKSLLRLAVESLVDSLRAKAHGSVFSTITMQTLQEATIVDLSSPELAQLNGALERLEERRVTAMRENQCLAGTRDELSSLLLSGKIAVKDAEKRVEQEV